MSSGDPASSVKARLAMVSHRRGLSPTNYQCSPLYASVWQIPSTDPPKYRQFNQSSICPINYSRIGAFVSKEMQYPRPKHKTLHNDGKVQVRVVPAHRLLRLVFFCNARPASCLVIQAKSSKTKPKQAEQIKRHANESAAQTYRIIGLGALPSLQLFGHHETRESRFPRPAPLRGLVNTFRASCSPAKPRKHAVQTQGMTNGT